MDTDQEQALKSQREEQRLDRELREEKADTQRYMAWVSLSSMIAITSALVCPFVNVERVHALADLLGLFYIAQAGIVGAYMGFQSWLSAPSKSA